MSTPPISQSLPERFEREIPEILRRWEAKVRAAVPAARRVSRIVVLNSIPVFLRELCHALSGHGDVEALQRRAPQEHAEQRADLPEYSLGQVVEEYSILRSTILESLARTGPLELVDIKVILDTIDTAVAEATSHYVELQERALRESEERFRLLVSNVRDYAIFVLDPAGIVVSWNIGAQRIKGYAAEEIVGRHFSRFYREQDVADGKPDRGLRVALTEERFEDEGWRVRKDGSEFFAHVVITAMRDKQNRVRGFSKVTRDVTERRAFEHELQRRAATLAEANVRKDEFLAILSHELRNPLAPILSSVQVLRRQLKEPANSAAVEIIDRQANHLKNLVDDLLDVARITSGKIGLRRQPLQLQPLVQQVVAATRPFVDQRQQMFTQQIVNTPIWVDADPTRLSQILANLLHNSTKFTERGGRIHLRLSVEDANAHIEVQDTGIGIEHDLLPYVFDLFSQGKSMAHKLDGGLGVGLALVRRLTELHGGTVTASSEGLGRGSTFSLRLPVLERPDSAASVAPQMDLASSPTFATRILVVDDNVDAAVGVAMLLEAYGHVVRVVHRGYDALAAAIAHEANVVLLDIGMPELDGYQVARILRAEPALAATRIIALSGFGREEDKKRSREAGFDAHLTKPADYAAIRDILMETF
ncbi:MAG TPA: ATP-binding protein [Steroidobacteraceae bacterium]|nr:ATP-binding protein [Steroidobacteraceae bacterium]